MINNQFQKKILYISIFESADQQTMDVAGTRII